MTTRLRPRRLLCTTLAGAAFAVGAVGCSGGVETLGSRSGGGAESRLTNESSQADAAAPHRSGGAGSARRGPATAVGLLPAHVIRRASLTVRTRQVGTALQRVQVIVAGVQGIVADEHTVTSRRGEPRRSTLTLRVPAAAFDETVQELEDLGRLQAQRLSSEDVSTQVVDVDTRVLSAERTLRRIRELLEQADDFSDVLSLEGELARREADLASLKAQQAYLEDQTSMSTISLTLLPPRGTAEPSGEEPAGFVSGLRVGWDALVSLVSVVLTAVGVLVPLLLVLAPLGLLTWAVARRLLRRPATPAPAQPSAD